MKALRFSLVLLFAAGLAVAQQHPNQEVGFNANHVYQFTDLDSVNLFNGNVTLRIPLGLNYPVGPSFSYQFALTYNSNVWSYLWDAGYADDPTHTTYMDAMPNIRSNVGMGWRLSFGRLLDPRDSVAQPWRENGSWVYEGPSGDEHVFQNFTNPQNPSQLTGVAGSEDGSYLRLVKIDSTHYNVEFPDGQVHEFVRERGHFRLHRMRDRFMSGGFPVNYVDFSYTYNEGGRVTLWTITDSQNRIHNVHLDTTDVGMEHGFEAGQNVTSIEVQTAGSPAIYTFDLSSHSVAIGYGANPRPTTSTTTPTIMDALLLDSVTLPDGSAFQFQYSAGTGHSIDSAALTQWTTPTGATTTYQYGIYDLPGTDPCIAPTALTKVPGLVRKTNADGTTFYQQMLGPEQTVTFPNTNPCGNGGSYMEVPGGPVNPGSDGPHAPHHWSRTSVLSPGVDVPGSTTKKRIRTDHYFHVWSSGYGQSDDPYGSNAFDDQGPFEYGWPVTTAGPADADLNKPFSVTPADVDRADTGGSPAGPYRHLSEVVMDGCNNDESGGGCTEIRRSTYLRYARNGYFGSPIPAPGTPVIQHDTVDSTRTYYLDDTCLEGSVQKPCYMQSQLSDWDGAGHYRMSVTSSNFGEPSITSYTHYLSPGEPSSASTRWITGLYDEKLVREGASQVRSFACFDSATGFLKAQRVLKGTNAAGDFLVDAATVPLPPGPNDIVITLEPDARGNPEWEAYYGGDRQGGVGSQEVAAFCSAPTLPATPEYLLHHHYVGPILDWTRYHDGSKADSAALPFKTVDRDVQAKTGMITAVRDTAQVQTTYTYDNAPARLTRVTSPTGATTDYTYVPATPTAPARIHVLSSGGGEHDESEIQYDRVGRVAREAHLLPEGWSVVQTRYDAMGRKLDTSEPQLFATIPSASFEPALKTTFLYDAFSRPAKTIGPDGAAVDVAYSGVRNVTRTVRVADGPNGSQSSKTTAEQYDTQNRLVHLTEPDGISSTSYTYDVAGHLLTVAMTAGSVTQNRSFVYDGRGFLLSEKHPEKGKPGLSGPNVLYSQYDTKGHAGQRIDGGDPAQFSGTELRPKVVTYTFDRAERLTDVSEGGASLKEFTFADANDTGNYKRGKLESATRHNRVTSADQAVHDLAVTDSYTYEAGGRVDTKTTSITSDGEDIQSLEQKFTYSALGPVQSVKYPNLPGCVGETCDTFPDRVVTNTYTAGRLTGIAGYGQITYWPNGLTKDVTHLSVAGTSAPGVDTQMVDGAVPPTGTVIASLPRPQSISFSGYCLVPIPPSQPADVTITSGARATLSATVAGPNLTYQWFTKPVGAPSSAITGATGSSYTTDPLTVPTQYWVRVTDNTAGAQCSSDSRVATVTPAPCSQVTITSQPQSTTIAAGTTTTLTVVAQTTTSTPLTYAWFEGRTGDRSHPTGVTTSSFTTPALTAVKSYWVEIRAGESCAVLSTSATVSICGAPVIRNDLSDTLVAKPASGTLTLSVVFDVDGTGLTYTWHKLVGTVETTYPNAGPIWEDTFDSVANNNYVIWCDATTGAASGVPAACQGTVTSHHIRFGTASCEVPVINTTGSQFLFPGGGNFVQLSAESLTTTLTDDKFQWFHGFGDPIPVGSGPHPTLTVTTYDVAWCRITLPTCTITTPKAYFSLYGSCPLPPVKVAPTAIRGVAGTPVTITALSDWPTVHYQWYRGMTGDTRNPIAGATSRILSIASASPENYWCRVTDECGRNHIDSDTVPVTTNSAGTQCGPITVNQPPQSADIVAGAEVTLAIDATSSRPFDVTWYANGVVVPELTGLAITVSPSVTTTYYAVLHERAVGGIYTCGGTTVTTIPAVVRIRSCSGLTVTTQPQSTSISYDAVPGYAAAADLSVTASASGAVTYAWYIGPQGDTSNPIAGATSATLHVTPAVTTSYWVRMTSATCTVDSDVATVTVCHKPAFTTAPQGGDVQSGQQFLLQAFGDSATAGYEWRNSAGSVIGTTNMMWIHPTLTGTYTARLKSTCDGVYVDSAPIRVTACTATTITTQPADQMVFTGASATLTVAATGTTGDAADLRYIWMKASDNTVLQNSASPTYTTPAITTQQQYVVRVVGGACVADSRVVTVGVCQLPAVVGSPQTIPIQPNQSTTLDPGTLPGTNTVTWYEGPAGDVAHSIVIAGPSSATTTTVAPSVTKQYWATIKHDADLCVSRTEQFTVSVCKPQITSQPQGTTVLPSVSTTLAVTAGPANVTYQWYAGNAGDTTSPITGATAASVSVAPAATTTYWVRVNGSCEFANSSAATVTVCQAPVITTQPSGSNVSSGQSATLSISATGTGLQYKWYKGNPGDTSVLVASTASTSVTPSATTSYWARITDACGTTTDSTGATVSVCTTPTVTTQPQSQSIFSGATATLSVAATSLGGTPSFTYQWYGGPAGNLAAIAGATSATYTTAALTSDRQYFCHITTGACSIDSQTAAISLCALPQNLAAPTGAGDIQLGEVRRLQVTGVGTSGNTYNWFSGNPGDTSHPVASNQTADYIDVSPSTTTTYWAQVVQGGCTSSTGATTVRVCKTKITQQPANASILSGQSATLTLTATLGTSHQWYAGSSGDTTSPVSGGTAASLTVSPAATTSYWCKVTGSCDSSNSSAATVTVCVTPAIATQPQGYTVTANTNATLSVTATGPGLSYQWYRGVSGDTNNPLNGKTAASMTTLITSTDRYWVKVSNSCGSVNSIAVWLSVAATINSQSGDVYMNAGSHANASFSPSGTFLSYQWYLNNTTTPIGTNATYVVTAPLSAQSTLFAAVTSGAATTNTMPITVHMCTGPVIQSFFLSGGSSCPTLFVTVSSSSNVCRYDWYRGTSGDTAMLVHSSLYDNAYNVCPATSGQQYWVRVVGIDDAAGDPNDENHCYTDSATLTIP